jgi:hypothetical protein
MTPPLPSVQTRPSVTVVRGSDLHPRYFLEILAILLPKWQDTDPYLDDIAAIMRNAGDDILVRVADGRIDGVLRTKSIRAGGDPRQVPATFEELVGPYWSRRDPDPDTRMLVDVTKRDGAFGVAKTLVDSALNTFQEPNLGTFSPEDAVRLHTHFGACAVRRIPAGRPRHAPSQVVVMCYRGFAQRDHSPAAF